ncbi:DUF1254 domain-containing protein [Tateyamaria sp.]|uniref:DUF1254 domain-containing protein n=1 Tax=Tateyamaria sp. TaxID=1929288 RepID=UPI0039B92517
MFPVVINYRTIYARALKQGEFGEWLHLCASSPAGTDIVPPNNDTPHSYACVDLRVEPWVLTMPEIESEPFSRASGMTCRAMFLIIRGL